MRDMAVKGRSGRGTREEILRGVATLTPAAVVEIRQRLAAGETQEAIAARYGVTQGDISQINRRAIWADVGGPEGRHTSENHGVRNGRAKLTLSDVATIRTEANSTTRAALARRFGVSEGAIRFVIQGRNWRSPASPA